MEQLFESDVADIFTTDEVASTLMCSLKSNYSWDIEIKKFGNMVFLDKRQDDAENNILNYSTVCENAIEHQPKDDKGVNGIKALMREAKQINNSWLHFAQNKDPAGVVNFDDENPFIEDENQVATRVGYQYRIWKI